MSLTVNQITDSKFKKYARIIQNCNCSQLLEVMANTPITNEVSYVPSVAELESLPIYQTFQDSMFGGMPIQIGYCNGINDKLNAVEYHLSSEFLIPATDIIIIYGLRQDIDTNQYTYDTSLMEAFIIPSGTIVETYATTLHFAPCNAKPTGFRCTIVLPKGTGDPINKPNNIEDDKILLGKNKWVICHPETDLAKQGTYVGLKGENLTAVL